MDYFKKLPGPTPSEDLPFPRSKQEAVKEKSDSLSKRKLSDEAFG